MAKILVIEDEVSIRKLIHYDLTRLNHEVDLAEDGNVGMEKGLNNDYDIVLVDWMLPGHDGLEIVEKFRKNHIDAILIMLTAKDEESDILEAFEKGVDDYITKPFSPRELSARINAHLRRYQGDSTEKQLKINNIEIDLDKYMVTIDGEEVDLTKKEFELLVYLASNRDIVLSRDKILNKIWNFDYDGDTRIVDVHVFKLRSKLDKAAVTIKSIRGVGYVFKSTMD